MGLHSRLLGLALSRCSSEGRVKLSVSLGSISELIGGNFFPDQYFYLQIPFLSHLCLGGKVGGFQKRPRVFYANTHFELISSIDFI